MQIGTCHRNPGGCSRLSFADSTAPERGYDASLASAHSHAFALSSQALTKSISLA